MTQVSAEDVRSFLKTFLEKRAAAQGLGNFTDLPDDCDLLLSGVIDSLGLLELMTAASEHYGREIDFESLDPEQMTIVGPFCEFVSIQIGEGRQDNGV